MLWSNFLPKDVPYVIPALRMQQSKLSFLCDAAHIPEGNEFANALKHMQSIQPLIYAEIAASETTLVSLLERLCSMGVGDSVARWLQGDAGNSFFEFKVEPDEELTRQIIQSSHTPFVIKHRIFRNIELLATKSYSAGITVISMVFQVMQESNFTVIYECHSTTFTSAFLNPLMIIPYWIAVFQMLAGRGGDTSYSHMITELLGGRPSGKLAFGKLYQH